MSYQNSRVQEVARILKQRIGELKDKADVLRAVELKALYAEIPTLPADERGAFGKEINKLKAELEDLVEEHRSHSGDQTKGAIDVTAPFDVNVPANKRPSLLGANQGSRHPLMIERQVIADIFERMGFSIELSRELDDEWHMFTSLNFPAGHPARDDYDTFMTEETDANGHQLVAPAHTSTMQNRMLRKYRGNLDNGRPIAVLIPDRTFRNEDVDARHEHTFHQFEGIYVDKGINAGHLVATLKAYFQEYFGREIKAKLQPFYFPFTEPSFEFVTSCPFCQEKGCSICGHVGWIELGGCGMIHPNVLKMADIDPNTYTGFAWGFGVERPVMIKYSVEDIRHFNSGKLGFLKQFS